MIQYYASAEDFAELYPNASADAYERFAWDAQKAIDNATLTVDGVKKLRIAYPEREDDAEAVRRCMCALINTLSLIDAAEAAANAASGYVETSDGYHSANVRSISAGGESITFAADAAAESEVTRAAKSEGAKRKYITGVIERYLRGACDANGVNLLYGGAYPRRFL